MLVIWLYVLTAFVAATVYGFRNLYPDAAAREAFIAAAGQQPGAALAVRTALRQLARLADRLARLGVSRLSGPR